METVIKEKWNEGMTNADNSYMKSRRVTIDPITRLEGHGKIDILLDEKGEQISSSELAKMLERWRDEGVAEVRFCLGAADGFDDADRADADKLIAFGHATWPHLMARAMLAEQLYRATSILANHPYHREG